MKSKFLTINSPNFWLGFWVLTYAVFCITSLFEKDTPKLFYFFARGLNLYNLFFLCGFLILFLSKIQKRAIKTPLIVLSISSMVGPFLNFYKPAIYGDEESSLPKKHVICGAQKTTVNDFFHCLREFKKPKEIDLKDSHTDIKFFVKFTTIPDNLKSYLMQALAGQFEVYSHPYILTNYERLHTYCLKGQKCNEDQAILRIRWTKSAIKSFLKTKEFCLYLHPQNKTEGGTLLVRDLKKTKLKNRADYYILNHEKYPLNKFDGAFFVTFEFQDEKNKVVKVMF